MRRGGPTDDERVLARAVRKQLAADQLKRVRQAIREAKSIPSLNELTRGLSWRDLGKRTGIHYATLRGWLSGKRTGPDFADGIYLSKALGQTPEALSLYLSQARRLWVERLTLGHGRRKDMCMCSLCVRQRVYSQRTAAQKRRRQELALIRRQKAITQSLGQSTDTDDNRDEPRVSAMESMRASSKRILEATVSAASAGAETPAGDEPSQ